MKKILVASFLFCLCLIVYKFRLKTSFAFPCSECECSESGAEVCCYLPVPWCYSCSGGELCHEKEACVCEESNEKCKTEEACLNDPDCSDGFWGRSAYCGPRDGGCFAPETKISTPGGQKAISELKVGDEVVSQNPESGGENRSLVEKIHEVTRSAYYKIKMKNGKEIKVTGEHPLWAIKKQEKPLSFWEYLKTESLTKKAITWLLNKF